MGANLRWAVIRGWALIKCSPLSASVVCLFCNKTLKGNNKKDECKSSGNTASNMSVMKCEGCVNHHVTMDVTNTGNWQRAQQTGNEKWEQNGELEMKLLHDGDRV